MLMMMLKAWMMGGRQVGGKQLVFQLAAAETRTNYWQQMKTIRAKISQVLIQQKRAQTIANKRKQFEQRLAKFWSRVTLSEWELYATNNNQAVKPAPELTSIYLFLMMVFAHLNAFDRSFNLHILQMLGTISHSCFRKCPLKKRNPLFCLMGECTLQCTGRLSEKSDSSS